MNKQAGEIGPDTIYFFNYKALTPVFLLTPVRSVIFILISFLFFDVGNIGVMLFIVVVDIIALRVVFQQYRVSEIFIGEDGIRYKEINMLYMTRNCQYDLLKLDLIYRNRPVSRHYRGAVLTVFYDGTALFDLEPGKGGWSDTMIRSVVASLKLLGVKQVLEKFGSDDVEV